jgi:CheY-like chemotaxis protein
MHEYQVEVAHSGPAAIEGARRFQPELIVCDIGLPGMDGYQVARALRDDPLTAMAGFIALTGYGQEEDQERGREAGFDAHLTKPVDFNELLRLLEQMLSERQGVGVDPSPCPLPESERGS